MPVHGGEGVEHEPGARAGDKYKYEIISHNGDVLPLKSDPFAFASEPGALVAFAPKPPPQSVVGSAIAPYVIDAAHVIAAIAPREMREGFREGHERIRRIWKEALEKRAPKAPREEL